MRSGLRSGEGSALVETVLMLPLLLLLLLNVVNFGTCMYAWITVAGAARAAAEYSVYNGVAVQYPAAPSFTQIQNLVNNEISGLPGAAPSLKVCYNKNGTVTSVGGIGTCTTAADPQPALYTSYSATVSYTFTPVFSSFTFLPLGISLTLPATTIVQTVTMRSMQ